jgi:hypothetical protein
VDAEALLSSSARCCATDNNSTEELGYKLVRTSIFSTLRTYNDDKTFVLSNTDLFMGNNIGSIT